MILMSIPRMISTRERLHREIGVAFQAGALFGSMTLGENIALPLQQYTNLPEEEIHSIAKMKLIMVNLAGYENHFPAELSGGMQKRAGIGPGHGSGSYGPLLR